MKMKKIGILTHYYGSNNYGGLLQAYALCKKLSNLGYDAEQICFKSNQMINDEIIQKKASKGFRGLAHWIVSLLQGKITSRKLIMKNFRENFIPHSDIVYTEENIDESNEKYDLFITGSDQVWNLNWYEHVYFLDFVKEKPKISYAASFGMEQLSDGQKELLNEKLKNYKAISVREDKAVELIKNYTDYDAEKVLDPTLLLNSDEWDEIVPERKINKPYLFCYFLGKRNDIRELAIEYAENNSLKLVTIPYLLGNYRKCDLKFGDIKLFDPNPSEFISLIKYADCVMTDSFHACVFSNIYKKNYFVFQRYLSGKMSSRIYSLLDLFKCGERFCDNKEKENLQYIEKVTVESQSQKIIEEQEKSLNYIRNAIDNKETL